MRGYLSIRSKLLLLSVMSIALPFAAVGTYTYLEYSARVEARALRDSERLLKQIAVGVARFVKSVDDLSLAPLYNEEFIELLKRRRATDLDFDRASDPEYGTAELMQIIRFLSSLRFDRNEVRSVGLFVADGMGFSYGEGFSNERWSRATQPWIERARNAEGAAIILPTMTNGGPLSLVRQLREPFTHAELGFIRVEFTARNLERAIFPSLAERGDYILLVYNAYEELLYPESLTNMAFIGKRGLIEYDGVDYVASFYRSESERLSFYGLVPYKEVRRDAQTLTSASAVIALISMLLACVLAVMIADRIVLPLRQLAERMAAVRGGSFDARVAISSRDEVGELAEDFNLMAAEIQRLIDEVYRVNLKEQEAEIQLLQSQINPHFLYNTLETISMMAIERDRTDISDTVTSLGKLLRYSSTGMERRVPLGSELLFARNYMAIQSLRLGGRINLELAVDSRLLDCLVPKLSIQPFVENVIEHALDERPVRVRVTAFERDGDLIVSIEDDGRGLSVEAAADLEVRMRFPDCPDVPAPFGSIRRGVALRNIHQRAALMHGARYGVSVFPGDIRGARFELRVPFERRVV